ncbi:MAG: hypothetical protein AAGA66_08345 [Bacteroidota bacterium]
MNQKAFGVQSIEIGTINESTGLGESYTSVGDVYKDTAIVEEEEPTSNDHFAELKRDPVISVVENGSETIRFDLMDAGADVLVNLLGGTATDVVDQPDIWSKPLGHTNIEKAIRITTDDGTIFTFNRVKIMASRNLQPTRQGIFLVKVMGKVLTPLINDLPSVTITDNAVTNTSS